MVVLSDEGMNLAEKHYDDLAQGDYWDEMQAERRDWEDAVRRLEGAK